MRLAAGLVASPGIGRFSASQRSTTASVSVPCGREARVATRTKTQLRSWAEQPANSGRGAGLLVQVAGPLGAERAVPALAKDAHCRPRQRTALEREVDQRHDRVVDQVGRVE